MCPVLVLADKFSIVICRKYPIATLQSKYIRFFSKSLFAMCILCSHLFSSTYLGSTAEILTDYHKVFKKYISLPDLTLIIHLRKGHVTCKSDFRIFFRILHSQR